MVTITNLQAIFKINIKIPLIVIVDRDRRGSEKNLFMIRNNDPLMTSNDNHFTEMIFKNRVYREKKI